MLIIVPCNAAVNSYYYKHIGTQEGLTQPSITAILTDYKGMLWIGTRSGLNLYHNNRLTSYLDVQSNNSVIEGNRIHMIYEDINKNLWVSTDKGISLYDRNSDVFKLQLKGVAFTAVEYNNKTYFGGQNLFTVYDHNKKTFTSISKALASCRIIKLIPMSAKMMLVITKNHGIYNYNTINGTITPITDPLLSGQVIMDAYYMKSSGLIYLSVFRHGLYVMNSECKIIRRFGLDNSGLTHDLILSILDNNGMLWLGTDGGGISILNPKTNEIKPFSGKDGYEHDAIPTQSITVLYKDLLDNIWAGSVRFGLFGMKKTFIHTFHSVPFGNSFGLSNNTVISMCVDNNQTLWLGTDGGGVNKFNYNTNTFTHYPRVMNDKVSSVSDYNDEYLIVSLYCKGVFLFNKNTGECTPFIIIDNKTNDQECFSGCTPMIYKISKNIIYIFSDKAYIYNINTKQFSLFNKDKNVSVRELKLFYNENNVSYAFSQSEVVKINSTTNHMSRLFKVDASININSAAFYNGNIWIGTDNGLYRFNIGDGKIEHIDTPLFNRITQLKQASRGRLFVAADNMLFCYFINEKSFEIIDEGDGFAPNEIASSLYSNDYALKDVFLGGTQGLVRILDDMQINRLNEAKIELFEVLVNGKKTTFETDKTITIPWDYSSFSLAVNIEGNDPFRRVMHRYMVSGTSTVSIDSYENYLSLPALQTGKYNVKASYLRKDGKWSEPVDILHIRVSPPWYRNVYTYLLLIIILAIGVWYSIHRLRVSNREKLEKSLLQQKEVEDIERIQFLVNISHELRTPLTLIYSPLKNIVKGDFSVTGDLLKAKLNQVFNQVCRMRDIINMVLDIERIKSSSEVLRKMPYDIGKWVRSVGDDFVDEMQNASIELKYVIDEQIGIVWFDKWKCQIVLSNFLMNALKYSPKNTTVTVVVTSTESGMARIVVSDEGPGLGNLASDKLFERFGQGTLSANGTGIGLSYSKKLMMLHGGNIGAYNNVIKGASFYFEIPFISSDNTLNEDEPIGTSESIVDTKEFSQYSVLIVDDNDELRSFLKDELSQLFKKVFISADGEDALRQIKAVVPDIIISDIMMPKMDGYALCRALKSDLSISHIPIILLTAKGDADSVLVGYKLGADFYIPKPFDNDFLFTIIGNVLKNRQQIRERYKDFTSATPSPLQSTFTLADEQFLLKFNDYIIRNLSDKELDIHSIISEMAMSRSSLYSKVKALTGLGVSEYISKIKLNEAAKLLQSTDNSITVIAESLGFGTQRYFSSVFKAAYGVTPRDYRQQNNKVGEE